MTLSISGLKNDQVRALEYLLRRKYDSTALVNDLVRKYLLDFVVNELKNDADAALENHNGE